MKQLTPIEKYALNYLELFHTPTGPEKEGNSEVRAGSAFRVKWPEVNVSCVELKE